METIWQGYPCVSFWMSMEILCMPIFPIEEIEIHVCRMIFKYIILHKLKKILYKNDKKRITSDRPKIDSFNSYMR